ncbi:MAG TPA: hypothetical protein VF597_03845 [Candidatus Saccharimonadales bacterium]|jgi:hypothetical protein
MQHPDTSSDPPPRTQAEVERRVIAKLSDTSDPDNFMSYDLSAKRPVKEKALVVVKGLGYILLFAFIMLIGKVVDESVLHIQPSDARRTELLSVSGFLFLFLVFGVMILVARYRLRR